MSDLTERLRDPKTEGACWCCQSAADEIERLTVENSKLWDICHAYAKRDVDGAFDDLRKAINSISKGTL